jgi:hypothetical protein
MGKWLHIKLIMAQAIHLLPSRLFVPPTQFLIPQAYPTIHPQGQAIVEQAHQTSNFNYKDKKGETAPRPLKLTKLFLL